jgi:hypothetical protein
MLEFVSDGLYSVRRALASRPRRRYTLEYLGLSTFNYWIIRDFIQANRNGVLPFSWVHPTAWAVVPATNTTPVWLQYLHGMVTGQWVNIGSGPAGLLGTWQVTRVDNSNLILNGSVASGAGVTVSVAVYLPYAIARFNENQWESPVKLIGPEQLALAGRREGFFNAAIQIEEIF